MPVEQSNSPSSRHMKKKKSSSELLPNNSNSNSSSAQKRTIYNYLVESDNLRRQQENILKDKFELKKDESYGIHIQENDLISNQLKINSFGLNYANIPSKPTRQKKRGRTSASMQRKKKLQTHSQKIEGISRKPKRSGRPPAMHSNQEISVPSSFSYLNNQNRYSTNQANILAYINDLFTAKTKQQIGQIFSINSLFHSSSSLLTKLDIKALFQPKLFETLTRQSQLKLIKLLPECDRQLDPHGSFKLSSGALNNEFIKKCCVEWQNKLISGEFGNFSYNQYLSSGSCYDNYENSLLNKSTTITRSTRLKQERILQNLRDQNESSEEEFIFYDEYDSSLDDTIDSKIYQEDQKFHTESEKDLKHVQDSIKFNKIENFESSIKVKEEFIYESSKESSICIKSSSEESEIDESSLNKNELRNYISGTSELNLLVNESDQESLGNKTTPTILSDNSSSISLTEEDLEAKRRLLQRKAKRLLKKNKKLRENFKITADCMIANIKEVHQVQNSKISESFCSQKPDLVVERSNLTNLPVRKSQRKRQTSRKFNEKDYALNIDNLQSRSSNQLPANIKNVDLIKKKTKNFKVKMNTGERKSNSNLNVSLEAEQNGDLKLRIKRIISNTSLDTSGVSGVSTILTSLVNSQSTESCGSNKMEFLSDEKTSIESCEHIGEERRSRKRQISEFANITNNEYKNVFLYSTENGEIDIDQDHINQLIMIASSPTNSNQVASEASINEEVGNSISKNFTKIKNPSTKTFNFSASCNIFPDVVNLTSPTISPCSSSANAPMTRAAAAKLKQHSLLMPSSPSALNLISAGNQGSTSSLIDAKHLPPTPLPVPPQDLFNDDENEVDLSLLRNHDSSSEFTKSFIIEERLDNTENKMENESLKKSIRDENNCRTLAQLKAKIAETKRKSFNDKLNVLKKNKVDDSGQSCVVSSFDSYSSNIQKIVHELKSIGGHATQHQEKHEIISKPPVLRFLCEKEIKNDTKSSQVFDTNDKLEDKKRTIVEDFITIIPDNNDSHFGKSFTNKEKKQKCCENERDLTAKSKVNAKNMKFISNIQDDIDKKININSNHLSNLDGIKMNLLCVIQLQKQFEEKCDFVKFNIDTNLIDQPINLESEGFSSNMITDNIKDDKQSLVELPSVNTVFSFLEVNFFSEKPSKKHNQESYKTKIESKNNHQQYHKSLKNGNLKTYSNELVRNFDDSSILSKDSISESSAMSNFSASPIESDKFEIDADLIALQSRISEAEPFLSNQYQSKAIIQNSTSNFISSKNSSNSSSITRHSTLSSIETHQNSNLTLDSFSSTFKQGLNNHQFQNSIIQTSQNCNFQTNNYSTYSKYSTPERSQANASFRMRSDYQSLDASQISRNINLSVSGNIYTQKPLSGQQYQSAQNFQNQHINSLSYDSSSCAASSQLNMGQFRQTTFNNQSTNQNHYQNFQNSIAIDFKSNDSSQYPQHLLAAKNVDIASSQHQQMKLINDSVPNSIHSQPLLLSESENSEKSQVSNSKIDNEDDNSFCIAKVETTFKPKLDLKNSCEKKKQPKTSDNLEYNIESKINQSPQENVPSSGSPSPYSNSGSGLASTSTKVKRSIKEKNNINSGNVSSQSSNASNNSQIMSTNSQNSNLTQSKSQRSTQHQLTVAQLLSQKHLQQNQMELKHGSDSNHVRIITSPLTVSTSQQSLQNKLSDVSEIMPTSNLNSASMSSKIIKINLNQPKTAEAAGELKDENLSEIAAIKKAEETKDEPVSEIIKVTPNQKININSALKQNLITNFKTSSINSSQSFQTIQNNGSGASQVYLRNIKSQNNLTQISNSATTSGNIGSLAATNAKLVGNSVSDFIINKKNSISSTNNSKFDNISTTNSSQGSLNANLTVPSTTTISIPSLSHSAKLITSNNLIGNPISNSSKLIQKNELNQNSNFSVDSKFSSSLDNPRSDVHTDNIELASFNESDTTFNVKKTNEHICLNTGPMIECIKCGEFSHSNCLINQNKKDDMTEIICPKCSDQMKINRYEKPS